MLQTALSILLTLVLIAPGWAATHSGTLTLSFDLSAHSPEQAVELWIPYPVSNATQQIDRVHWDGTYSEAAVYTDRVFGTPLLYARWEPGGKDRRLQLRFRAERVAQQHRDLPSVEGRYEPQDLALYLAPTSLGPVDGPVKALADQITAGKTGILAKARAVYDWTVEHSFRDPDTRGCGVGDVNALLKRPGGKCADISSLFVAIARAAGVPSREIFGLRMGRSGAQEVTTWQHCWAEFFLPGYGWVPVDPADVRKAMLKEEVELDSPRVAELREYFWGGLDPYRVRLSEGRDLVLNPPQSGSPLNYLMYPYAEVGGQALDWLDPKTFRYTITYTP